MSSFFGELIDCTPVQRELDVLREQLVQRARHLRENKDLEFRCADCSRRRQCESSINSPVPIGYGHKKILLIGQDLPDKNVATILSDLGIDADRDCWILPPVLYKSAQYNNKVTDAEIARCRPRVLQWIKQNKPEKILLFGTPALKSVIGHRASGRIKMDAEAWAGWTIPDQEFHSWIFPMYGLYAVQSAGKKYEMLPKLFRKHLRIAVKHNDMFPDNSFLRKKCGVLQTEEEAIAWIKKCTVRGITSFDLETTGIKPHRKEQKILYVSIANEDYSYGFRMYPSRAFLSVWANYLMSKGAKKIAHNAKFEHAWNLIKYGIETDGWWLDSAIAAHLLDNRRDIVNLKFQTYAKFGFIGYDNVMDLYIQTVKPGEDPKSGNHLNMMEYADPDEAMLYCAEDSSFTRALGVFQKQALRGHRSIGYTLFHESFQTYTRMETVGIRVDYDALIKVEAKVKKKIEDTLIAIKNDPAVKSWEVKRQAVFDHTKKELLSDFLFKHLREAPVNLTKVTQTPSTDKESLEAMYRRNHLGVLKQIIAYNKWTKILSTYVEGTKREIVDGVIHCNLGLIGVRTYRTSCSSINLQNIPKRDPEVRDLLRAMFFPRKNNRFAEYDFKAFEVSIYACYSQDQALMNYVSDLTKDMHRDIAAYIFKIKPEEVDKKVRQETKSGFVFAQLYGANYTTCAQYYWDWFSTDAGQPFWKSFSERSGIRSYSTFEEWMEQVERHFWYTMFPQLGQWKDGKWDEYLKAGRMKFLSGFYMTGNLTRTQIANGDVQGTASHIKLAVMNMVNEKFIRDGVGTRCFLEIHDSILVDGPESEDAYVDSVFKWVVNTKIPELYPWINVPLFLEKAAAGVDRPWNEIEEIGIINK